MVSVFRFGLIRASSYRLNRKPDTTFFHKVAILFKAINMEKTFVGRDTLYIVHPLLLRCCPRCSDLSWSAVSQQKCCCCCFCCLCCHLKTSSGILFIIKNLGIQDCLLLLNSRLGENIYKICVSLPDYAVADIIHIEIFRTKK